MATIAKTVGSFDKVLASCKTIGAQYQPSVTELTPAALAQLQDRAQQSLRVATEARIAYLMAVNNRKKSFEGIFKLAVRVVRMMNVCSRDEQAHLEDAARIKNKLSRSGTSQKSDKVKQTTTEAPAQATRASGRLSFPQQIETFSNLVELASKIGNYNPTEPDLTLEGLRQKLEDLHARSKEVAEAKAVYKQARMDRDRVIKGKDGIRFMSRAVRNYVQGAFGAKSDQAEQIKGNVV